MKDLTNMIVLGASDNVGIALRGIGAGETAVSDDGRRIACIEDIPLGHKLALEPIAEGQKLIRFGVSVGIAKSAIRSGALAHVHNVRSQYLDNDEDHYE
jgi:altronate hydrolase